jgi:hypothetical protein
MPNATVTALVRARENVLLMDLLHRQRMATDANPGMRRRRRRFDTL